MSGPGLDVSTVSTDSGVITVNVVGKTKSRNPGDFSLYAHHNTTGVNFPSNQGFPVTVVVPGAIAGPDVKPIYQHDTTGTPIMQNMALNRTTSPVVNVDRDHVELDSVYGRRLTITVVDQFGDPLGDLYKDAEVEEILFGIVVSINSPLSNSGTYTDPVGYKMDGNQLVWDRTLGRPFNDVALPAGWMLTSVSVPAVVSVDSEGRVVCRFFNPRNDEIHVILKAKKRATN